MTMISISIRRKSVFLLSAKTWRMVFHWIAAIKTHRELHKASAELHQMNDRDMKDIGINRGTIDYMIGRAADRRPRRRPDNI